jgi:nucleoside 2-deoxyribosyltransferase
LKSIYLAGRINGFTLQDANSWRSEVESKLNGIAKCRNPLRGKQEKLRYEYTDGEIVVRDKTDIRNSDIILAYLPERGIGPTVGTTMEIMFAYTLGKPILFIGDWAKDDIWMRYHVTKIFSTLDDAIEDIKAMWLS